MNTFQIPRDISWPQFRALRPDEVDVRVQQVTKTSVICLLYKNARTDMALLDETVGPMNWKREHKRDNANCIISIWDSEKNEWVSKEDTGTESNTEAEKGLASDSFKRAGTNWGIGRELYTSPFIKIPISKCNVEDTGKQDRFGNPILRCKTRFIVSAMDVNDKKQITYLVISDGKTVLYEHGKPGHEQPVTPDSPDVEITVAKSMCKQAVKSWCQSHNGDENAAWKVVAQEIGKPSKDFTTEDWRRGQKIAEGWQ